MVAKDTDVGKFFFSWVPLRTESTATSISGISERRRGETGEVGECGKRKTAERENEIVVRMAEG